MTRLAAEGVDVSHDDAHEARTALLQHAKVKVKPVVRDKPAEKAGQRGALANAEAQKRNADAFAALAHPAKVRKLRADMKHHEKQITLHTAELQRIRDECAALESADT